MDQPRSLIRRLPWGVLLIAVFLALVAAFLYLPQHATDGLLYVACATVAGTAAYLTGRRLMAPLWGFILAITLVVHPIWTRAGLPLPALAGEALKLCILFCLVSAWRCAYSSRPRPGKLLFIGAKLVLLNALAWLTSQPQHGTPGDPAAALLSLVGLLLAAGLFLRSGAKSVTIVALALLLALVVPVAGAFLALPLSQGVTLLKEQGSADLSRLLPAQFADVQAVLNLVDSSLRPHWRQPTMPGFTVAEREDWGWPNFWLMLVLALFGLARSAWRGGVQWSRGQPPLAWLLLLFTAAVAASFLLIPFVTKDNLLFVPLATLTVLLALFGLADWVFGVGEKIRLAPPEERAPAAPQ